MARNTDKSRVERKTFEVARDYMREYYINGYLTRDELNDLNDLPGGRTLSEYWSRLERWLPASLNVNKKGHKSVYTIDIDSREENHNPLYAAWKYCNGSVRSMAVYFAVLRYYAEDGTAVDKTQLKYRLQGYMGFDQYDVDDSTIGKAIEALTSLGILEKVARRGGDSAYRLASGFDVEAALLNFFSEMAECGVIGSFLLDRQSEEPDIFSFKHHFLSAALDSEVVIHLLVAMHEKREVVMKAVIRDNDDVILNCVPLKIVDNAVTGRKYVAAYVRDEDRYIFIRIDHIHMDYPKCMGTVASDFDELRATFNEYSKHIWASSAYNIGKTPKKVEFTIEVDDSERHFLPNKLNREKRIGTVTKIDDNHYKFSAEVYDGRELIPWINSYLGRITEVYFEDKAVERRFRSNLDKIMKEYGDEEN